MKYEAPICELLKITSVDIIRTSGADDDNDENESPFVDGSGFLN